jgi:hypothetical protein
MICLFLLPFPSTSNRQSHNRIKIFIKNHKGELIKEVEGNEGDDMVDLSWEWDLDIEGKQNKKNYYFPPFFSPVTGVETS